MFREGYWLKKNVTSIYIVSKLGMLHVLQYETQLIYTPVSDFQDNMHCIL